MRPLVVLRPEPGATRTRAAARALGLEVVTMPLFVVRPLVWQPPADRPDAVLMTSANAARHGGAGLAMLAALPLYAVGETTAAAARAAGFSTVIAGEDDGAAIVARAAADGVRRLLHLAGREHRPLAVPGVAIERRVVYAADAVATSPDLPDDAVALLHSPRAAALFAARVPDRTVIAVAAISAATLTAAGTGWRATAVAERPTDAALLAVAAKLCDQ